MYFQQQKLKIKDEITKQMQSDYFTT